MYIRILIIKSFLYTIAVLIDESNAQLIIFSEFLFSKSSVDQSIQIIN